MNGDKDQNCAGERYFDVKVKAVPLPDDWSARLLFLPVDDANEIPEFVTPKLSPSEQDRASKFRNPRHGRLFALRRQFQRYCAHLALARTRPDWPEFENIEGQRPLVKNAPEICFSFSSSRAGLIGGWCTAGRIGFDLETLRSIPEAPELAREFYTKTEASRIEGLEPPLNQLEYLRLWCLKEAALKSIGKGVPFGLHRFEFDISRDVRCLAAPGLDKTRVKPLIIDTLPDCICAAVWIPPKQEDSEK